MRCILKASVGGLLSIVVVLACTSAAGHQRAHEHGVGEINVALEGETLELTLEAPGDNFVGFEHSPRNTQERTAVHAAEQNLRQVTGLFALPAAAKCTLRTANVQTNDKASKHSGGHDHDDAHTEWRASYAFLCTVPAALDAIDATGLFRSFPQTRSLRAQVIGPDGQSGSTLTPDAARMTLRPR